MTYDYGDLALVWELRSFGDDKDATALLTMECRAPFTLPRV